MSKNLSVIERKMLGALIQLMNDEMFVHVSMIDLARRMGYTATGGGLTFALQALEMKNHIAITQLAEKGHRGRKLIAQVLV